MVTMKGRQLMTFITYAQIDELIPAEFEMTPEEREALWTEFYES